MGKNSNVKKQYYIDMEGDLLWEADRSVEYRPEDAALYRRYYNNISFRTAWAYGYFRLDHGEAGRWEGKKGNRIFKLMITDTRRLKIKYADELKSGVEPIVIKACVNGEYKIVRPEMISAENPELWKVNEFVHWLDQEIREVYPGYGIFPHEEDPFEGDLDDSMILKYREVDEILRSMSEKANPAFGILNHYSLGWIMTTDCWCEEKKAEEVMSSLKTVLKELDFYDFSQYWNQTLDLKKKIAERLGKEEVPFPEVPSLKFKPFDRKRFNETLTRIRSEQKTEKESYPRLTLPWLGLVDIPRGEYQENEEYVEDEEYDLCELGFEESKPYEEIYDKETDIHTSESEDDENGGTDVKDVKGVKDGDKGNSDDGTGISDVKDEKDKKDKDDEKIRVGMFRRDRDTNRHWFMESWGETIEKKGLEGFLDEIMDILSQRLSLSEGIELTDHNKKKLKEFLRFFYRTVIEDDSRVFGRKDCGYYNLLLITPEPDVARCIFEEMFEIIEYTFSVDVVDWKKDIINIASSSEGFGEESEWSKYADPDESWAENTYQKLKKGLDGFAAVLVDGVSGLTEYNPDNHESLSNYNFGREQAALKAIARYARKQKDAEENDFSEPMMIMAVSPGVARDLMQINTELYYRAFGNHTYVSGRNDANIESMLYQVFADLPVSEDFKTKLSDYCREVYPGAELRSKRFVDDMRDRVLSRFFSRPNESVIDSSFIPRYRQNADSPDAILGELNRMIGLTKVKEKFKEFYKAEVLRMDKGEDKTKRERPMHMIFAGNPGTGKTTVARLATNLFFAMNIISKKNLVEVNPADLQSRYLGGTREKAREVIHRAYGGVLFIDEAYDFMSGEYYARQALSILLQEMEDNGDRLIVIFAGYEKEMEKFLKMNSGLKSRIGEDQILHFENYSDEELLLILKQKCQEESFRLDNSAEDLAMKCIRDLRSKPHFGNARDMRTLFDRLQKAWNDEAFEKLEKPNEMPEKVFYEWHFEKIMPKKNPNLLDNLVGLKAIKKQLQEFENRENYLKARREEGRKELGSFSRHLIFKGNPGTGKTTVAQLLADTLYSIGTLPSNRIIVAERKDLVSNHVGETAIKTGEIIEKARGGILFIDEAYSLVPKGMGNDLGQETIATLITAMENYKEDTIFIFAGYSEEMDRFIESNPGIRSRIGYTFTFEDYSVEELMEIFDRSMAGKGFKVKESARKKVCEIMNYFHSLPDFGNGRFVEHVIDRIINLRAGRGTSKNLQEIIAKDIPDVADIIKTAPDGMRLYDPKKISKAEKRRTAIHEIGHAVVMYKLDSKNPPEKISIISEAGSLGRVALKADRHSGFTERELINMIAGLLGGRNAEIALLGECSTGCAEDYKSARSISESMVSDYAMGELGVTTGLDFLKKGDALAKEVIEKYKDFIGSFAETLLEKQEISGTEFCEMIKNVK